MENPGTFNSKLCGYTGHCPQYAFRSGGTYGSLTHQILLDPKTHKSHQYVLSDATVSDYQQCGVKQEGVPSIKHLQANSVYQTPMTPGYSGTIPNQQFAVGTTFNVGVRQGLDKYEAEKLKQKEALNNLRNEVAASKGEFEPTITEKAKSTARYKLPLLEARPEYSNIIRNVMKTEESESPAQKQSPYFMEMSDPEKSFKSGYTGHIPFGHSKYGQGYAPLTNSALCDFTANYRTKKNTEWAPVNIIKAEPPLVISANEIYHRHLGMVPNYSGHIPGYIFRSGRTFGTDTRDAKRWLRGEFS